MGLTLLAERHAEQIAGVLSCVDRVIVQGTLPVFCYADGMAAYLSKRRILHRLRTHGLIKKASHCYKYYLTALGKQVVAGPQTQGACHYSRTCGGALPLISKFCQFRQEPNYVGTNGRWAQPIGINFSIFKSRTLACEVPGTLLLLIWFPSGHRPVSLRIRIAIRGTAGSLACPAHFFQPLPIRFSIPRSVG